MAIEQIVEALGDKAGLIDEVRGVFDNNTANVGRIGTLETELSDAVGRRKKLHDIVSTATGLNELSEENMTKFAANADEGLKADNETLKGNLAELQGRYDGLGTQHEAEISEMILKDTLRGLGIGDRVANDRAFTELTKLVLAGAERDGAAFIFKEEGKTLFGDGGKPLNVEDRIAQLQESDYSYLFKAAKGGGGGQGTVPGSSSTGSKNDNQRANEMMKRMGHRSA